MAQTVFGGQNRLTYTEVHASILGFVVGSLAWYAHELGRTTLAVTAGAVFVAIALGVYMRGRLPVAQRTIRHEPWYALAAFVVGGAVSTLV